MLNYVKCEWYRVTHSAGIYIFTAVMVGLAFFLNIVLWLLNATDPDFRYGTVSFSLSMLASAMNIIFLVGAGIVGSIFAGDKKDGIKKNALAAGISREKIFVAKCIVSVGISFCILIVILFVYIGSAVLLLEQGINPDAVMMTLRGVAYVLIIAVAFEVFAVGVYDYLDQKSISYFVWYVVVVLVPLVCKFLGARYTIFAKIVSWMPYYFLSDTVTVNMNGWDCMWETPEGVEKCIISGIVGLIIFSTFGLWICRKKEA